MTKRYCLKSLGKEEIMNMYEESNGDISDDSDVEKEEDNYDE